MGPKRYTYVHVDVPAHEVKMAERVLWEVGCGGLEERDGPDCITLVAYFARLSLAEQVVLLLRERWPARLAFVVGERWRDAWRAHFKPTRVGTHLIVRPPWERVRRKPGEVLLTIEPGRAFGTGTHETTRLVLGELDARVRGGERVLDVGCGSGILSIAALLLGAAHARAVDNDRTAPDVVRENAARNHVAGRLATSSTPLARLRGVYDVVVANIEARALVHMASDLKRRIAPDGFLVLSGILRGQVSEVRRAYRPLRCVARPVDGEWVALVLIRSRR